MSNSCPTCEKVKAVLEQWAKKQGHDRCWYYPDLFRKLGIILGVTASQNPKLPPRSEFEEGCRRYQEEEYGAK